MLPPPPPFGVLLLGQEESSMPQETPLLPEEGCPKGGVVGEPNSLLFTPL